MADWKSAASDGEDYRLLMTIPESTPIPAQEGQGRGQAAGRRPAGQVDGVPEERLGLGGPQLGQRREQLGQASVDGQIGPGGRHRDGRTGQPPCSAVMR